MLKISPPAFLQAALFQEVVLKITDTAWAEIAELSPVNPSPSSVVAFILMLEIFILSVSDSFTRIWGIYSLSFGFCAIMVASMLEIL